MSRDLNVDQIKKLWILDLVLHEGSLKKAALKAKVSPSAISQTITSLEQSYGRAMLVRERGFVLPTQDAIAILEIVRPAFAAFDRLRGLNGAPIPEIAWMNFGTYESIAITILPGLLHSLKQKLPKMRLGLRISRTASLLTMLRKGDLCSALITEVEGLDRFYVKKVADDRLGLYISNRHPISELGLTNAIAQHGLGSLAPGKDGLPQYYSKFMIRLDVAKPVILSDSFEALRAAAAAGSIVAVLPDRVAGRSDDLIELTPSRTGSKLAKGKTEDIGQHGIFVVSPRNCDRAEADFLAEEASRLMELS